MTTIDDLIMVCENTYQIPLEIHCKIPPNSKLYCTNPCDFKISDGIGYKQHKAIKLYVAFNPEIYQTEKEAEEAYLKDTHFKEKIDDVAYTLFT